ncbi:MAG: KOW domain-containing RNA-binding protein [Clostridiales bacterium]|jgi:ribosomal protein L14E/L6E/L27E|nr:KOW domain-containing RNA-binding protein [Clostridiales bacterium]
MLKTTNSISSVLSQKVKKANVVKKAKTKKPNLDTKQGDAVVGTLAVSKCGRDEGVCYIVVGLAQEKDHVMCSDGKYRKLSKPKKKRIKHLNLKSQIEPIRKKLLENKKVFDSEIFSAIKAVQEQSDK